MRVALVRQSKKMLLDDMQLTPVYIHLSLLGLSILMIRVERKPWGVYFGLLGFYLFFKEQ